MRQNQNSSFFNIIAGIHEDMRYLEGFPHLINHICPAWDDAEEVISIPERLLANYRIGQREGFDLRP